MDRGRYVFSSLMGSTTWNPTNMASTSSRNVAVLVSGAEMGDFAQASFSLDVQDLQLTADVTNTSTVSCVLANNTGAAVNLNSGTLYVKVEKRQ